MFKRLRKNTSQNQLNKTEKNGSHIKAKPSFISQYKITNEVIQETIMIMKEEGNHNKEGLVFWSGDIDANIAVIKTVISPEVESTLISAQVNDDGLAYIRKTLKNNNEFLFAQVHSHPGSAFHSIEDETESISYKIGFISIVIPNFGMHMKDLPECCIYEHIGESFWVELDEETIKSKFIITPKIK